MEIESFNKMRHPFGCNKAQDHHGKHSTSLETSQDCLLRDKPIFGPYFGS